MRTGKLFLLVLLIGFAGASQAGPRGHHGGHAYFGFSFSPYWGPWYSAPPVYYQPPVVVEVPARPAFYQTAPAVAPTVVAPPANYWYYCEPAQAYYPYVKQCPSGWQKVPAQPVDAE